jgi:hypothetical protein
MNTIRIRAPIPLLGLLLVVLAACGGGPAASPTAAPAGYSLEAGQIAAAPSAPPLSTPSPIPEATMPPAAEAATAAPAAGGPGASAPPVAPNDPSRKIIKDATLTLEVANVDLALSRISGAAAQVGGYVLETRTDQVGPDQKQALLKLAVPVDQFEAMLQRIREAGSRVLSEAASGTDASQEYVDTQSQLANLEATQARIRQFLEQAKTVEEALQVNAQLTGIEGQIGQLKGRLQFLSQRAAYSTIAVQIQQPPPPTPTITPTATPSPTPTLEPLWNPGRTATQASSTLATIVQALATIALWLAIVVLPLALPVVVIVLAARWLRRRAAPLPPQPGPGGE